MKTITVSWDFEDTDLEGLPTLQAMDEAGLPHEVALPVGMIDDDEISDWLSDTYGFTHFGWSYTNDGIPSWNE
mgnify:CR=1 FL=1